METFDYIFAIGVFVVVSLRVWQTFFNKNKSPGMKKEGWTFPIAVMVYNLIIVGIVAEYIVVTREINYKVSFVGLLLGGFGLFLTLSSIRSLGRLWSLSIGIKKDHNIIKYGVYHYVRHPYYIGVLFEVTGFILFANSYYMFILVLLLFLVLIYRIILEERVMTSAFGEEYENYKREVCGFFPLIRRNKCE